MLASLRARPPPRVARRTAPLAGCVAFPRPPGRIFAVATRSWLPGSGSPPRTRRSASPAGGRRQSAGSGPPA
eukprot:3875951-Alexandrium_andersonii.AAC.1